MTEEGAPPALPEPKFTLTLLQIQDERKSALLKCTDCEVVTVHEMVEARPLPVTETPPIVDVLKTIRRVIMCTNCAKISLKK